MCKSPTFGHSYSASNINKICTEAGNLVNPTVPAERLSTVSSPYMVTYVIDNTVSYVLFIASAGDQQSKTIYETTNVS